MTKDFVLIGVLLVVAWFGWFLTEQKFKKIHKEIDSEYKKIRRNQK